MLAFPTESRHVIFIDGLDSIVTQKDLQFQSLAALMHETWDLNHLFQREARPFKFVVLCRTDIFERLPGSNINKIRQDDSVSLNWYDAPGDPDRTRLIRLVNLRAERSLGRAVNVFDELLPPRIGERETRTVILDHTRHTPRDLVQVLRKIQQASAGEPVPTPRHVKSGLRAYSTEYFVPELRNELAGHLDADDVDKALLLLTSMDRPRVTYAELDRAADELQLRLDLRGLVRTLFDASCIGTVSDAHGPPAAAHVQVPQPERDRAAGRDAAHPPGRAEGAQYRATIRSCSSPARTSSPGWSWRPRRSSGSPLTSTACSARNAFASPLESITPGELEQLAEPDHVGRICTSRTRTA